MVNSFARFGTSCFSILGWYVEQSWLSKTLYMPGRIWTNGVDSRLAESINERGEESSVDGSLALDESPNTFWDVNPAGTMMS